MLNIRGIDKAKVLQLLYAAARPQGLGHLAAISAPEQLTYDEARRMLGGDLYFDYVKGRPLKVDLSGDQLDPRLYDRDQGEGAALRALKPLGVRLAD